MPPTVQHQHHLFHAHHHHHGPQQGSRPSFDHAPLAHSRNPSSSNNDCNLSNPTPPKRLRLDSDSSHFPPASTDSSDSTALQRLDSSASTASSSAAHPSPASVVDQPSPSDLYASANADYAPAPDHSASFATLGKKRNRIGQACERCKDRKIKCDNQPGRCANCERNGAQCTYKDPNSGTSIARGHTSHLEGENQSLQLEIAKLKREKAALEGRVRDLSSTTTTTTNTTAASKPSFTPPVPSSNLPHTPLSYDDDPMQLSHPRRSSGPVVAAATMPNSTSRLPLKPEPAQPPKHMGVPASEGALQDIGRMTGYTLSVFGVEIDALKFVAEETWSSSGDMSWKYFMKNIHADPHPPGTLPPRLAQFPESVEEMRGIADLYMSFVNCWLPVIPRQQLDALITKIYAHYDPNSAELTPVDVCRIHMVLALVKYKDWHKNRKTMAARHLPWDVVRKQVMAHYVFVIKHFHHLMNNHSLDTLQVSVLVSGFLREFPHPGAVWMMTHWAMAIAIDLNLHRSFNSLDEKERRDIQEHESRRQGIPFEDVVELRKRIYWSIFSMRIMSCGSLSRPIEMRWEDYDIEIPEIKPDMDRDRVTIPDQACSFRCGIEFFKLSEIYRDAYNDIYAIRPTCNTDARVRDLEQRQDAWRMNLPMTLQSRQTFFHMDEFSTFSDMLANMDARLTLAIHHPAVAATRSESGKSVALKLDKITGACKKILETADRLRQSKSLDVTWSAVTCYIAAIFTLLWTFLQARKRQHPLSLLLTELYGDLYTGLVILEVVGAELGTGQQLQKRIESVIKSWHNSIGLSYDEWRQAMHQKASRSPVTPLSAPAWFGHIRNDMSSASSGPYRSMMPPRSDSLPVNATRASQSIPPVAAEPNSVKADASSEKIDDSQVFDWSDFANSLQESTREQPDAARHSSSRGGSPPIRGEELPQRNDPPWPGATGYEHPASREKRRTPSLGGSLQHAPRQSLPNYPDPSRTHNHNFSH